MYFLKKNLKCKIPFYIIVSCMFTFCLIMSHEYSVNDLDLKTVDPYINISDYSDVLESYNLLQEKKLSPVLCMISYDRDYLEENIFLYGQDASINNLLQLLDLGYDKQNSLFSFSKILNRVDIYELKTIETDRIADMFFILGADEKIVKELPAEWLWENRIGNVYYPEKTLWQNTLSKLIPLWGVISFICIFLVYINIEVHKKTYFVQMINGTSDKIIILTNVIADGLFYLFICFAGYAFIKQIGVVFWEQYSLALIIGLLFLVDLLLYSIVFKTNIRKVFSKDVGDQKTLSFCFALKGMVSFFLLLAISLNGKTIADYLELSKNYDFYDAHRDYYMTSEPEVGHWDDYNNYYNKELEKGNVELYMYLYTTASGNPVYKINQNSLKYIQGMYPSLGELKISEEMIIAPVNADNNEIESLKRKINSFGKSSIYEAYYKEKKDMPLLGAGKEDEYEYANNMIFVMYREKLEEDGEYSADPLWAIYRSENGEFVISDGVTLKGINITSAYFNEYISKRKLFSLSMLCVLMLVLIGTILTIYIMDLEFKLNAKYFLLKRLNGNNRWHTYAFILFANVITVAIGMIISIITGSRIIEDFQMEVAFIEMVILVIIEFIIGVICIALNEKKNMIKIFKTGGI